MIEFTRKTKSTTRALAAILLAAVLILSACSTQPPSRFDEAQRLSSQKGVEAVSDKASSGANFNQFFPSASGSYQLVFAQEKQGFAQAKLKQDGKTLASLSIFDIISNPSAAAKYEQSTEKVQGYPVVQQGSKGTSLLVDERFQVKITSSDDSFSPSDRLEWLQKFNLRGLAQLK